MFRPKVGCDVAVSGATCTKKLAGPAARVNLQKETQHEKFSEARRCQASWISDNCDHLARTVALRCGDGTKSSHRLECNCRHHSAQWKSGYISRLKYFRWHEPLSGLYTFGDL